MFINVYTFVYNNVYKNAKVKRIFCVCVCLANCLVQIFGFACKALFFTEKCLDKPLFVFSVYFN